MFLRAALILSVSLASVSQSFAECNESSWRGKKAISFDEAYKLLPTIAKKDEFETTAAYDERLAAARKSAPFALLIERKLDPKGVKFDADKGELIVTKWALGDERFDWYKHIRGNSTVVGAAISKTDTPGRTYEATNGYGARIRVQEFDRKTQALYQAVSCYGAKPCDGLFPGSPPPYDPTGRTTAATIEEFAIAGRISMAPADAKRIKEQGKVLLLIEPREPFKMAGSHVIVEPSFSSPYKVTENYELILGNITCAMIADDQVKVYGSWDTN